MTSGADNASTASHRRRNAQASRRSLLDAARVLFERSGYEGATTRDIGERAGVDPALIARYFGSKEGLYLATIAEEPLGALSDEVATNPRTLVTQLLERWDEHGHSPVSRALASPAMSAQVREAVDAAVARLTDPLAAALADRGVPASRLRAELLIATVLGSVITRANGSLPTLAGAAVADVLAVLGPALDALVPPGAPGTTSG